MGLDRQKACMDEEASSSCQTTYATPRFSLWASWHRFLQCSRLCEESQHLRKAHPILHHLAPLPRTAWWRKGPVPLPNHPMDKARVNRHQWREIRQGRFLPVQMLAKVRLSLGTSPHSPPIAGCSSDLNYLQCQAVLIATTASCREKKAQDDSTLALKHNKTI